MNAAVKKFDFEVGVYRPPSEGGSHSLLVRLTRNCPWNRCAFCGMYKGEKFEVRSVAEIKRDIETISDICKHLTDISAEQGSRGRVTRRSVIQLLGNAPELNGHPGISMVFSWLQSGAKTVFLQDANSLLMKTVELVEILEYLKKRFPSIERITSYARSQTIARKPQAELYAIRKAGLDRLHVGLETGDDALLKKIKKGVTSEGHIKGGRKALKAGFQLSEYWMPGLGGKAMWENHARNTAKVLNAIDPHYIRSRPVFPAPGTPLHDQYKRGEYEMLTPHEQLSELKLMIEGLDVDSRVCFDHASNYWRNPRGGLLFSQSYEGYPFPEAKPMLLELIEAGLKFDSTRPMHFRL